MYLDSVDLANFYNTGLGHVTRRLIRRKIRSIWPNTSGLTIIGLGYGTPFLRPFLMEADNVFALMPAQQGGTYWPVDGSNRVVISEDDELPFQDSSIDRMVLVHCMECTEHLRPMLKEVWRVLTGDGRLIVVVPNRSGVWARTERTPFGFGQPYSSSQLSRLLRDGMFIPEKMERALFIPPSARRVVLRSASGIEDLGSRWLKHLGGVIIVEAAKQIYAASQIKKARSKANRMIPVSSARFMNLEKY